MKRITRCILLLLLGLVVRANDAVYLGSGNQLIPLQETQIAVAREVLTIRLLDNGRARVDVVYELDNRGEAKTVLMGFEADAPYNAESASPDGRHPYMSDFRVEMNGQQQAYETAIVRPDIAREGLQPIDIGPMKGSPQWEDMGNVFVSQTGDTCVHYACAYYFKAPFRPGRNTVRHTYEYALSYSVAACFELAYKLTPATRWANRGIDDFTLRIVADHTAKHFFLADDSLFAQAPLRIAQGAGKLRPARWQDADGFEVTLRNGVLEWHATGFRPESELHLVSADALQDFSHPALGSFYDRSEGFLEGITFRQQTQTDSVQTLGSREKRILRNLPYAHRGYVFHNRRLRRYFKHLWWYMPDPAWEASTADFTPQELQLIEASRP